MSYLTPFWTRLRSLVKILFHNLTQTNKILYYGQVNRRGKISFARFELTVVSGHISLKYAPFGITPTEFRNINKQDDTISFVWPYNGTEYSCILKSNQAVNNPEYSGKCIAENKDEFYVRMNTPAAEDAAFLGETLAPCLTDIAIINRARELLNEGKNWNRTDDRICDKKDYPDKWTLFCALYQASLKRLAYISTIVLL